MRLIFLKTEDLREEICQEEKVLIILDTVLVMAIMKNLVIMIIEEDKETLVILLMLLVLMHSTEAIREIIKEVVGEIGIKMLDLVISITPKLLETLNLIGILLNQPVRFASKLDILQMSAGNLLNSWLLVLIDHHQIEIQGQHI